MIIVEDSVDSFGSHFLHLCGHDGSIGKILFIHFKKSFLEDLELRIFFHPFLIFYCFVPYLFLQCTNLGIYFLQLQDKQFVSSKTDYTRQCEVREFVIDFYLSVVFNLSNFSH